MKASSSDWAYHSQAQRWIPNLDNFVAIRVQDSRSMNVCITVWGLPEGFQSTAPNLVLKKDRTNYSRFNVDRPDQVEGAVAVIKRAYRIKHERGR